jgi:hypothetical protein
MTIALRKSALVLDTTAQIAAMPIGLRNSTWHDHFAFQAPKHRYKSKEPA